MTIDKVTRSRTIAGGILIALIVVDQLTKAAMVNWIGRGADVHRHEFGFSWLAVEYVENTGAAFGILPSRTGQLAAISVLIVVAALFMIWRESQIDSWAALAIACVAGGAIGNIIDRVSRGYVVDFLAVGSWPKFNIADSAVSIGVMLLIWRMFNGPEPANTHR